MQRSFIRRCLPDDQKHVPFYFSELLIDFFENFSGVVKDASGTERSNVFKYCDQLVSEVRVFYEWWR